MIETGHVAPDFTLVNQKGEEVALSSHKGKKVVLFFYPKDNTPGCTKEVCSLRDHFGEITQKGAVIYGISRDSEASHQKFINKHTLPFDLLVDNEHQVMELYGAWGEKNIYGKKSIGVKRSTIIIDEEGKIIKIFRKVNTAIHGEEVLPYL